MPDFTTVGWRKALLACGVAAFLLYFALDLVAALLYDGYSYTDQTISELSAIGAETRSLWIPLGLAYGLLMVAYGFGVWVAAGERRSLRVVAACATLIGIVALVGWPFAPMHQREVLADGGGTFSDQLHIILSGIDGLLVMTAFVVGAIAFRGWFRFYSIATIMLVLVTSTLMGMQSPNVAENEPTPWIGVIERILVFSSMFWFAVLAVVLLHDQGTNGQRKLAHEASGQHAAVP